ncbi:hypothetical protein PENTCL1PPCAC_303, partial [Pristionchus entomophagus]
LDPEHRVTKDETIQVHHTAIVPCIATDGAVSQRPFVVDLCHRRVGERRETEDCLSRIECIEHETRCTRVKVEREVRHLHLATIGYGPIHSSRHSAIRIHL